MIKILGYPAATLAADNPLLGERQLAIETDTLRLKVGNGTDQYNDLPYITGEGASIETFQIVTASIADGAYEQASLNMAQAFHILEIAADKYSRVRLYKTGAAAVSDTARDFGDRSFVGTQHKMIIDTELTVGTGLTWVPSPSPLGHNADTPMTDEIYYTVHNNSGSTGVVTVDITVLILKR